MALETRLFPDGSKLSVGFRATEVGRRGKRAQYSISQEIRVTEGDGGSLAAQYVDSFKDELDRWLSRAVSRCQ